MPTRIVSDPTPDTTRDVAALLRVIGRGSRGSRDLNHTQARWLMQHMLRGQVGDAQLGAALMALRLKGETVEELSGFLQAVEADLPTLRTSRPVVVVASVNGGRKLTNQLPLLCMLLRQRRIATLVIGQEHDDGRAHTAALWTAVDLPRAHTTREAEAMLQADEPVYIDLRVLSPGLAALMDLRRVLGVRSAAHTLVKLLAPVAAPSLLLGGYTHGEYGPLMQELLDARGRTALLLHGCEGEAVPHPSRRTELLWTHLPPGTKAPAALPPAAETDTGLPPFDADLESSRAWSRGVLEGTLAAPTALTRFVDIISDAVLALDAPTPPPIEEPST